MAGVAAMAAVPESVHQAAEAAAASRREGHGAERVRPAALLLLRRERSGERAGRGPEVDAATAAAAAAAVRTAAVGAAISQRRQRGTRGASEGVARVGVEGAAEPRSAQAAEAERSSTRGGAICGASGTPVCQRSCAHFALPRCSRCHRRRCRGRTSHLRHRRVRHSRSRAAGSAAIAGFGSASAIADRLAAAVVIVVVLLVARARCRHQPSGCVCQIVSRRRRGGRRLRSGLLLPFGAARRHTAPRRRGRRRRGSRRAGLRLLLGARGVGLGQRA